MNAPRISLRMNPDVIARMVIWLWLLGLSVVVMLGFRTVNQLAEQVQSTVESQQVLALETRVAELANNIQALEAKPASATTAALQDVQQTLHARLAQIEQGLSAFVTTDALQTLRDEITQINTQLKARQAAARAAPPAPPRRPAKPAVVTPQPEPFPYRVVGVELRAGLRSILIAPATGAVAANQIQVVLPGDALGSWHLQAIDGNTAVFQSGEQIRRMTIPSGSE